MPFEDDEDLQDQLGTTTQVGYSSSRGQNPYTTQLQELLGKYLEQTDKQATESKRSLIRLVSVFLLVKQVLLMLKRLSVLPVPLANQHVLAASLRH